MAIEAPCGGAGRERLRGFWLLIIALLLSSSPTSAQHRATPSALRERLEALPRRGPDRSLPQGVLNSLGYQLDVAERIEGRFAEQAHTWRARVDRALTQAENGIDPFLSATGRISNRGYRSLLSEKMQGYALYLPPDFDPTQTYPLLIVLHGGSSNGNLFLGVVLGNNMSWEHYRDYLWDEFEPQVTPNIIIAAPDGFGQVMWRWMGERDVLDVIDDIQMHYPIDPDQVALMGLSNGGVGAYAIGSRHASRFSLVQAVAGAPSWIQYAGGRPRPDELRALAPLSMLSTPHNVRNTDFRFYHGDHDTGPMRPDFIRELERTLDREGIEKNNVWYDAGHDILYRVHRHGRRFDALADLRRNPHPHEVVIQSGDYRANTQHWVTLDRIDDYPTLAKLEARATDSVLEIKTDKVRAFSVDLAQAPLQEATLTIRVNDAEIYSGPRRALGHVIHVRRDAGTFVLGYPASNSDKRPGISGPITDAYHDRMVHVFGSLNPEHTETLRAAASRGARGWPLWLWSFQQRVIADSEVTAELAEHAHLVLYGNAADNAVIRDLQDELPIQISEQGITLGTTVFAEEGVGVRFVYPNPRAPNRYVIVQGGAEPSAVQAGHLLPDFLPDFVVYDGTTTRRRERLLRGRNRALAAGYFDDFWRLPGAEENQARTAYRMPSPRRGPRTVTPSTFRPTPGANKLSVLAWPKPRAKQGTPIAPEPGQDGRDRVQDVEIAQPLPVPRAPAVPRPPRTFLAPASDQAGAAARAIARLVPSFHNYRAEIAGAQWRSDRRSVWQIRPSEQCLADLAAMDVPFRALGDHPTPVPTPVEILGPIQGIWFRISHADRPLTISCELATRLHSLASILSRFNIRGAEIMSAYRETPRASFHTMGLGIDIARLWNGRTWINVLTDFEESPSTETCAATPSNARAARVLRITCAIARSKLFQSVLTPNYNAGHRNHWHLDARPNDPRLFLR